MRWTTRHDIQTNEGNTRKIFCRIYSVLSAQSALMLHECESTLGLAFGEDEECGQQNLMDAIGYLSHGLTINVWRRFLRASGKQTWRLRRWCWSITITQHRIWYMHVSSRNVHDDCNMWWSASNKKWKLRIIILNDKKIHSQNIFTICSYTCEYFASNCCTNQ